MTKRVLGLTGGIGVGKSTVATAMTELGASVIDCDELGRLVVAPGGLAYDALIDAFGVGVLAADGQLDRSKMAALVFDDPEALLDLNAVTHPAIDIEIAKRIVAAESPAVVLDMAVLVESDLGAGQYQEVVVVEAPLEDRLRRLEATRAMTTEQAMSRINSQATDEERRAVADHIIRNDRTLQELRLAVGRFWRSAGYHKIIAWSDE